MKVVRKGVEYDTEKHAWAEKCPYGDDCSGCDAIGRCTKVEPVRSCPSRELGQR